MKDKLDLEIIFYFTEAYHRLLEEGKISREEHEKIQALLDNLEQYPTELLQEKLNSIFADKKSGD